MAQGPIAATLYQPVQPQIGQGEAQVFSAPKTERVVDFMRREAAAIRAEERAQARKERQDFLDAVDTSLIATESLDVADRDAELYGQKYGELVDLTASQIKALEQGGTEAVKARMQITKEAAKLKRFSDRSLNYSKKLKLFRDDLAENEWKYDKSTIEKVKKITQTPGEDLPDALLLPDYTVNLTGNIDEAWKNLPDDVKDGFFSEDARYSIAGNAQITTRDMDTEAMVGWISDYVESDPDAMAAAAGRHKQAILDGKMTYEEAVQLTIQQEAARFESLRLSNTRTKQQPRGTGQGREEEEEENILADTLLADSQRAAATKDPELLREYVAGAGYNVIFNDEGNFALRSTDVSASGNRDDDIIVPSDDPEAITRAISDLIGLDPESVRKGSPASEEEIKELKRRVDLVTKEIDAIPAESKWSQISPEDLSAISSLEGVTVDTETGLFNGLWMLDDVVITIDGEKYDMSNKEKRLQASVKLRRKARKASSFTDNVGTEPNSGQERGSSNQPQVITDPSQLPD